MRRVVTASLLALALGCAGAPVRPRVDCADTLTRVQRAYAQARTAGVAVCMSAPESSACRLTQRALGLGGPLLEVADPEQCELFGDALRSLEMALELARAAREGR